MLLDDLVGVIETLKERIATHGDSLRTSETRTRMALIDPLLQSLGWDTSNPAMVAPEYSAGNGRADYALLDVAMNPVAFIEAKHLGEVLERPQHEDQLFTYALRQQVKFAALTDGNRWLLDDVSVFSGGERRLLQVSIGDTPTHEAALKFLLLWRPNLVSGQPVAAKAPVLIEPTGQPSRPVSQAPNSMTADVNTPTAALDSGDWIPLSRIDNVTGRKAPVAINFGDGETRPLRAWWQLLTESAEFLGRSGLLTVEHCPIDAGRGWRFINSGPHSPNGRNFITPKQVSNGIYMETHLSAKAVVSYSKRLLQHFGVNPQSVELLFE
jgi:hypothetical protein